MNWIRSSFCHQGSCVEVAWSKSSKCSGGACVEAARAGAVILVQDSKRPAAAGGSMQAWSVEEWQELLRAIRLAGPKSQPQHVALDFPDSGSTGHLVFGLHRHEEKLLFGFDEWRAFRDGVLNGEFDPEKLSGPVSSVADGAGREVEPDGDGSDRAATGAGEVRVDLPGPVPVAADPDDSPAGLVDTLATDEVDLSAGQPGTLDDEIDLHLYSPAGRQDEAPAPPLGPSSIPSNPAAGQPGSSTGGPDFADRSSVEAAGTGAPPVPVPVAEYGDLIMRKVEPRFIVEQAPPRTLLALEMLQAADHRALWVSRETVYVGYDAESVHEVAYRVVGWDAEQCALVLERLSPPSDEDVDAALARAAAPLVPTDGAS